LSTDNETMRVVLFIVCLLLTIMFIALVVVVAIKVKREYHSAKYHSTKGSRSPLFSALFMLMHLRVPGDYTDVARQYF